MGVGQGAVGGTVGPGTGGRQRGGEGAVWPWDTKHTTPVSHTSTKHVHNTSKKHMHNTSLKHVNNTGITYIMLI